jgi:hypothetical protein
MAETIIGETKRKGFKLQKTQPVKTQNKRGRELVPLAVGSYFTHNPSNVACMQIMRSNNSGRPRTSITRQHNLPLYSKSQSTFKSNTDMLPKKLNAKRQR